MIFNDRILQNFCIGGSRRDSLITPLQRIERIFQVGSIFVNRYATDIKMLTHELQQRIQNIVGVFYIEKVRGGVIAQVIAYNGGFIGFQTGGNRYGTQRQAVCRIIEHITILAVIFCLIEGAIRTQEQILKRGAVVGREGNANGAGKLALGNILCNLLMERFQQATTALTNQIQRWDMLEEDDKFITAKTSDDILTAE